MFHVERYDVIIVGGGHAGVEAAMAAARMGCQTLMITMNADQIGAMSCNPAIGGLGKSQLAREVDALGGLMCRAADASAIQYRLLNESKGPAVRATRVHVDRHEYRTIIKFACERQKNLKIKQGQVVKLLLSGAGAVEGVQTALRQNFLSSQVVITTGTFMNGKAHIGKVNFSSGRAGEPPSVGLSDFLRAMGISVGRLKTGTVPRVDRRSIDFSKVEEQPSQRQAGCISFFSGEMREDLESAHITFTNAQTHEVIRAGLHESPLYAGIIESSGPRYCPSVEDKVVRFSDKDRHQVFLEREGRHTEEVYVGGLSTSLPYETQLIFLRTIPGLENVEIIRPGYAIEYDFIDPTQLNQSLEMKNCPGLFFAGQVNGTSGYEEAAAQGIAAGVYAALRSKGVGDLALFQRSNSYIGVMIDDLVTQGTREPYRMFTSRAEYRLLLRQDNADMRLSPMAHRLGLLNDEEYKRIESKIETRESIRRGLEEYRLNPNQEVNSRLNLMGVSEIKVPTHLADLLRRPEVRIDRLLESFSILEGPVSDEDLKYVEAEIKYSGYIEQAKSQIHQAEKLEHLKIPLDFQYHGLGGLNHEAVEKLSKIRPETLGQAKRISGITPAAISLIAIHLSRKESKISSCGRAQVLDLMKESGVLENSGG